MSKKKTIKEIGASRSRKAKLERVSRDTTKHRETEETLRGPKDLYRAVMENAYFSFTMIDVNYKILMVNSAVSRSFHKPASELVGRECFREFEKRESICSHCPGKRAMVTGQPAEAETKGVRDDGSHFSVRIQAFLTIGPDGNVTGFVEIIEDITERKKAEQALQESEERYRAIFEQAADSIVLFDAKTGVMIDFNNKTHESLGYSSEEFQKLKISDIDAYESKQEVKKHIEKIVREGADTFETKHRTKSGEIRDILVNAKVISIGGRDLIHGIWSDITERKRAEKRLLDYQAQLKSLASQLTLTEERERRRIATELHATISQSLVVSKLQLDTLRASVPSRDITRTLEEVCNSLDQTIQETKSLTFNLSSPILYELGFETAVSEWLTERIQKKHHIATEFEDDKQPKPLDDDVRVLLFRDVRELLINVVKHAHARKVKVSIRRVDRNICITVEDDGVGFDFIGVASIATKTGGFGLFSIRERLEQLGGHLEVESKPRHGCKVTLTAPLQRAKTGDGA